MSKLSRIEKEIRKINKGVAAEREKDLDFIERIKDIVRPMCSTEEETMNYIKGMDIFKNEKFD